MGEADIAVAEAGVQLQRQAGVDAGPQRVAQQYRVGDPLVAAQPPVGGSADLRGGGSVRFHVEAVPVRDGRLGGDRAPDPFGRRGNPLSAGPGAGGVDRRCRRPCPLGAEVSKYPVVRIMSPGWEDFQ